MQTPQDLLDDIHKIGIAAAWDKALTPEARTIQIKAVRQKLGAARQSLKRCQEAINKRYGNADPSKITLAPTLLRPYALIEQLVNLIEAELNQLQSANNRGEALPPRSGFGQIFYGSEDYGSYVIADAANLRAIQKAQHQTMQKLDAQHRTLQTQRAELRGGFFKRATRATLNTLIRTYKAIVSIGAILVLVEVVFLFAALRGFSRGGRKEANWDATAATLLALGITLAVVVLPAFPLVYATTKITSSNPRIAGDIKSLDFQITENREAYHLAKRFHDEAVSGLNRLTGKGKKPS